MTCLHDESDKFDFSFMQSTDYFGLVTVRSTTFTADT
jgi:hypothetical protein